MRSLLTVIALLTMFALFSGQTTEAQIEAIVPFFVEGLPYHWGPFDMLKSVARPFVGERAFEFKIRLGLPIQTENLKEERNYIALTERVRQAVLQLAIDSKALKS